MLDHNTVLKHGKVWFYIAVMRPEDAYGKVDYIVSDLYFALFAADPQ